jgi:DHA1 family bicyclomycin/chloramphenicol resistance-like MFS transporter
MSVTALAIDALLPALDIIAFDLGILLQADNQLLVTLIFIGLGLGPLLFGPLSDSIGRKPSVYIGFFVFLMASVVCIQATSLELMILGRILQGIGLSAPRTICIAIIRDLYHGDYMARIMSFVTILFLLIPIVAPAMGKFILDNGNWKGIFYVQGAIGILVTIWFWIRQKETLAQTKRIPFKFNRIIRGAKQTLSHTRSIGFTLISGLIVGSFLVYLSASQHIFQQQYGLKEEFPYIFAGIAIAIGVAILLNGSFVVKYGMEKLVTLSLVGYFLVSILYIIIFFNTPTPHIVYLLIFFALQFFFIGFLFGNIRALAMEPVGHIAGIAAAITGFISTMMAVPISTLIGRFVAASTLPLFIGFACCSGISLLILVYIKLHSKSKIL